jgi:Tol biopolymer transport system component
MALSQGTRLGPYEILSAIGAGGMGEVYRARDTKLNRDVALKSLPELFAADPDRLARFEREAQVLASLNHPNIAQIHGLEESGSVRALVMELVPGETLADRIAQGPIALSEAVQLARQIAAALDAAHDRGIVHRDLKPANVKITPDGTVKVLDFGLAKALEASPATIDATASPTITSAAMTRAGVILGTAAYMAPEQARGKPVDKRADIWAFGCLFYEMLAGRRLFEGETVSDTLASVLTKEPDWNRVPANVRPLLRRCLEKDPRNRARDIGEAMAWVETAPESAPPQANVGWIWPGFALLATVAALSIAFVHFRANAPAPAAMSPLQVTRTVVSLPAGVSLGFAINSPALSPDGTRLAYIVAGRGDINQIYLQVLDEFEAKPIAGTEGAFGPFFSPDSRWLAFFVSGKLKKVAVSGGAPQTICDAGGGFFGATWGPDDTIVFAPTFREGLSKCAASGGARQVLTTPDKAKHEKSHRWPQFLPGGRAVLFNIISVDVPSFDDARIAVLALDTGQIRILLDGGTNPRFVPTGHLMYVRGASLIAVPFDPRRLEITGQSIPVLDGVTTASDEGAAHLSVAENGLLAYLRGDGRGSDKRVVWVDRQGRTEPLMDARRPFSSLRLSPDGQWLALTIMAANDQVWVYHLARRTLTPLTFAWDNHVDGWTQDGRRIVFSSGRAGAWNFYWQTADGSGPVERLTESPNAQASGSWSPDGRAFAFHERPPLSGPENIWLMTLASGGPTVRRLRQAPFSEREPAFSPNGRWLAYVSTESGRPEVFAQPFPGPGAKWQISTDGGTAPVWDPHGRELFYQDGRSLMAVAIQTQPRFLAGTPRLLFEGDYVAGVWHDYDVGPDGRFIMIQTAEAPRPQIALVQNWFEELKRRVAMK